MKKLKLLNKDKTENEITTEPKDKNLNDLVHELSDRLRLAGLSGLIVITDSQKNQVTSSAFGNDVEIVKGINKIKRSGIHQRVINILNSIS